MNIESFKVYDLVLEELLNLELINNNQPSPSIGDFQIIDLTNSPIINPTSPIIPPGTRGITLTPPSVNTTYVIINDSVDTRLINLLPNFNNNIVMNFSRIKGTTSNTATIGIGCLNTSPLSLILDVTLTISYVTNPFPDVVCDNIVLNTLNGSLTKIGGSAIPNSRIP